MWTVIITFIAVVVVALVLVGLVSAVRKKRTRLAHEKLDEDYIYRKEPHADQVAEKPNKLEGNQVTKG